MGCNQDGLKHGVLLSRLVGLVADTLSMPISGPTACSRMNVNCLALESIASNRKLVDCGEITLFYAHPAAAL